MVPQPKEVFRVTAQASCQFAVRPILFRVIRVHEWRSYWDGWVWLDGYELNPAWDAVSRRTIYVQPAGLIAATSPAPLRSRAGSPGGPARRGPTRPANRARHPRAYTDVEPQHRR